MRHLKTSSAMVALLAGVTLSTWANAAFIQTFEGNDCSGVFGQGFENCQIPEDIDPNQSPVIIKFNFNEDGTFGEIEINSLFPTITGSEFDFDFDGGSPPNDGNTGTGAWTYTPGAGDPVITFYVAKGGPNFNLFSNDGDPNSGDYFTPLNPGGNTPGISHLSFYDTGRQVVPEPGLASAVEPFVGRPGRMGPPPYQITTVPPFVSKKPASRRAFCCAALRDI